MKAWELVKNDEKKFDAYFEENFPVGAEIVNEKTSRRGYIVSKTFTIYARCKDEKGKYFQAKLTHCKNV